MKYLILLLVVVMSLPLIAQDKNNDDKIGTNIQTKEWMTKISSDSDMRSIMMGMMLDKIKGNEEEMTKLGKTIMGNSEMNSIIVGMVQRTSNSGSILIEPRGMMGDSTKKMKMSGYKLNPDK